MVRRMTDHAQVAGADNPEVKPVERLDPETIRDELVTAEHLVRYFWAAGVVSGKEVLDAG